MDSNVTSIFMQLVKEVRSDIKSIRDILAPMQVDLKNHIMRTDLNEDRIEAVENKLMNELSRQNDLLEQKLKLMRYVIGIISGLVTVAGIAYKYFWA